MAVWIISDLHLSLGAPYEPPEPAQAYKPMEIFGEAWRGHVERLYANWQRLVQPEDFVLLPGDISWAMDLAEGRHDFAYLGQLKGRLLISKGNHDFWWDTKSKAQAAMPPNVRLLQNEAAQADGLAVAAARGWYCPGSADFDAAAAKIYRRELLRLEMSLQSAQKLLAAAPGAKLIVMLHFPPVNDRLEYNEFIELMRKYQVRRCYYGHLHGQKAGWALRQASRWGIDFRLVSADDLGMCPLRIN